MSVKVIGKMYYFINLNFYSMTLLSFIAIIASMLAGVGAFAQTMYWEKVKENTPVWKRIWWKFLQAIDFEENSARRRCGLKIIFSVLCVVAVCCGFFDTISAFPVEQRGFRDLALSGIFSVGSLVLVICACVCVCIFNDILNEERLWFKEGSWQSKALGTGFFCIWGAIFVLGLWRSPSHAFVLISASAFIAVIVYWVLVFIGMLLCLFYKVFYWIIIYPIRRYIRWLRK